MERLSKFTIFSKHAIRMVEDDVRGCGGAYSRVVAVDELKHDAHFILIYRLTPTPLQARPQNRLKPCGSAHSWKYSDYASGMGLGNWMSALEQADRTLGSPLLVGCCGECGPGAVTGERQVSLN